MSKQRKPPRTRDKSIQHDECPELDWTMSWFWSWRFPGVFFFFFFSLGALTFGVSLGHFARFSFVSIYYYLMIDFTLQVEADGMGHSLWILEERSSQCILRGGNRLEQSTATFFFFPFSFWLLSALYLNHLLADHPEVCVRHSRYPLSSLMAREMQRAAQGSTVPQLAMAMPCHSVERCVLRWKMTAFFTVGRSPRDSRRDNQCKSRLFDHDRRCISLFGRWQTICQGSDVGMQGDGRIARLQRKILLRTCQWISWYSRNHIISSNQSKIITHRSHPKLVFFKIILLL